MTFTPRFKNCAIESCTRASVRGNLCFVCDKPLCFVHQKLGHSCPSLVELTEDRFRELGMAEIEEIQHRLNVDELLKRVSLLNEGKACHYASKESDGRDYLAGCANFHGRIVFDDQTEWLIRTPRKGFADCPPELLEYFITSEFATLKFLETTKVPAPKVFGYGLASDEENLVGVSYILMERLPGHPWDYGEEHKQNVLEAVADIIIELSKHPFPIAGSLVVEKGEVGVSKVASNRYVHLDTFGPCKTDKEYVLNICNQYLDLIADGQVCPDWPFEAFAFYSVFAAHFGETLPENESREFFLKHIDDKGDHILLDEAGNVTGIIDWQFARCVPAQEAFGPSYVTADQSQLQSANAGLSRDDRRLADILRSRGDPLLGLAMEKDEVMRRFHNGISDVDTKEDAREILRGMLTVLSKPQPRDLEQWMIGICEEHHQWSNLRIISNRVV